MPCMRVIMWPSKFEANHRIYPRLESIARGKPEMPGTTQECVRQEKVRAEIAWCFEEILSKTLCTFCTNFPSFSLAGKIGTNLLYAVHRRAGAEAGGFHELSGISPDYPKSGIDPTQAIHYNEQ